MLLMRKNKYVYITSSQRIRKSTRLSIFQVSEAWSKITIHLTYLFVLLAHYPIQLFTTYSSRDTQVGWSTFTNVRGKHNPIQKKLGINYLFAVFTHYAIVEFRSEIYAMTTFYMEFMNVWRDNLSKKTDETYVPLPAPWSFIYF